MCTDNSRIDLKQFGAYGMLVVVVIRYLTCFVPSGGGLGAREHHPSYEDLRHNIHARETTLSKSLEQLDPDGVLEGRHRAFLPEDPGSW